MTDHHDDDWQHDSFDELPPVTDPAADAGWHHDNTYHEIYEISDSLHAEPDHGAADPATDDSHEPDEADAVQVDDHFPPALDPLELPEPVDGFPWIDTALLGTAHLDSLPDPAAADLPVTAADLATYAGTDIPDGADGWQILTESDDPATAALARWWHPADDTPN